MERGTRVKGWLLAAVLAVQLPLAACGGGAGGYHPDASRDGRPSGPAVPAEEWEAPDSAAPPEEPEAWDPPVSYGSEEPLKLSDTDYADQSNWLRFDDRGMDVDIFAVYPTVVDSQTPEDLPYLRLENRNMRSVAAHWLDQRAEAVTYAGNVYAPLYRQLNGTLINASQFEAYVMATPREDVFAAFDYFLRQVNRNERPFILIGHSQGAALVAACATLLLGNKAYCDYNRNHIATYAIGYSVTQEQIARNPNLSFAARADDTGVILSWNTTAPREIESGAFRRFCTWSPEALTINPITWTCEETPAEATENGWSKVLLPSGGYEARAAYAGAVVDNTNRVLLAPSVPEAEYPGGGVVVSRFHRHDILFYYDSIRQNVADRIAAFGAARRRASPVPARLAK